MSGNKKNNNSNEGGGGGGFGLGTAVLLGAGAAAVGFLARDIWNTIQDQPSSSSGHEARTPPPRQPSTTGSNWEKETDKRFGARKKQREAFKERNDAPDELKCIICCDNPREICLVPCGHVCLCEDCADKIDTICPMCQQAFTAKKVIYM